MKPKIGQSFWDLYVDDGKIEFFEWIVTSIRRHKVPYSYYQTEFRAHLIRKSSYTWVKRSKKHGDYGWAKNISRYDRYRLTLNDDKSIAISSQDRMFTTKLKCLYHEEKYIRGLIKKGFESFDAVDGSKVTVAEQLEECNRNMRAVKRRITLERKRLNRNRKQ